jgi:hypothetical protein
MVAMMFLGFDPQQVAQIVPDLAGPAQQAPANPVNDEMTKMRTRVAAAATLNERCNRLEKLANEHQSAAQKHEAETQAVLEQLRELQRANLRVEQERDECKNKLYSSEEAARDREQDAEREFPPDPTGDAEGQVDQEADDRQQGDPDRPDKSAFSEPSEPPRIPQ